MKKAVITALVTAFIVFVLAWFFMSYGPGMAIKLAADPWTYFVKNLAHGAGFKLLVSAVSAGIAGAMVYRARRGREK